MESEGNQAPDADVAVGDEEAAECSVRKGLAPALRNLNFSAPAGASPLSQPKSRSTSVGDLSLKGFPGSMLIGDPWDPDINSAVNESAPGSGRRGE